MDAQKVFDDHRKKEGLATFKLSKGQAALIEDSGLPFLIRTKEERAATWASVEIKPMPRFMDPPKDEDAVTKRFRRMMEIEEQEKKERSLNSLKERVAKEKKERPPKPKMGQGLVIKLQPDAKRAPGTKAAARFADMIVYMKAHPNADVAEVIQNTTYRIDDYKWDLNKGNIKVVPVVKASVENLQVKITAEVAKPKLGPRKKPAKSKRSKK